MTDNIDDHRAPAWPEYEPGKPSDIYYNAIQFVVEHKLPLASADEISAEILEEMGAFGNGLIESKIRRLAGAITADRWQRAWLY